MWGCEMATRRRIRNFPRSRTIDCTSWLEFEVIEETYRYFRIRFLEVDAAGFTDDSDSVEFQQDTDEGTS